MSDSDSSHVPQAALATPRELTEVLAYQDISSNDHYHLDRLSCVSKAPINCDKALPPMPRPSIE